MKRKNRWIILLFSFVISGLLVYGMYLVQMKYIRSEDTVTVYVAKQWIQAGHIMTTNDLKQVSYPLSFLTEEMITNADNIIDKELIIPLGKEEPITSWKLNSFHLLPKQNQATFQIPANYIKSIANDIRAGDYVYLYASGDFVDSSKLFEQPIKVASVKTSTNVEVESLTLNEVDALLHSNEYELYQHRRKASGVIEYINLNLSEFEWLRIDELCKDGQVQLIIAYTPYVVLEH